jgi:prepilin-type N-terminal cleavage/methylation domain-containing protein
VIVQHNPVPSPFNGRKNTAPCVYSTEAGLTLIELIITVTIVAILAGAAIPVARFQVKREKERELRRDLTTRTPPTKEPFRSRRTPSATPRIWKLLSTESIFKERR